MNLAGINDYGVWSTCWPIFGTLIGFRWDTCAKVYCCLDSRALYSIRIHMCRMKDQIGSRTEPGLDHVRNSHWSTPDSPPHDSQSRRAVGFRERQDHCRTINAELNCAIGSNSRWVTWLVRYAWTCWISWKDWKSVCCNSGFYCCWTRAGR